MQPALAERVQKTTRPGSTATTGACRAARMSFPGCPPSARGSPKSSRKVTAPITGNRICAGGGPAAAVPASIAAKRKGKKRCTRLADGEPGLRAAGRPEEVPALDEAEVVRARAGRPRGALVHRRKAECLDDQARLRRVVCDG